MSTIPVAEMAVEFAAATVPQALLLSRRAVVVATGQRTDVPLRRRIYTVWAP